MIGRVLLSTIMLQCAVSAAVVTHSWREGTLDLTLDDGFAQLEWISPVAFHFVRHWNVTPVGPPLIHHDPVLIALDDSGPVIRMTTRYLTVEIPANLSIQVRNGNTPVASITMERSGQDVGVRFSPMDHVYGLGGGASSTLDLHGTAVERAGGFFYTSNQYAVYLPSAQNVTYDLSKGSASMRNSGQIEFAFYHGASPKEMLEQHLTVAGQTEVTVDSLGLLRADRVPKEATKLADLKIDSWAALANLVRLLY
jgi:hypothetical protein